MLKSFNNHISSLLTLTLLLLVASACSHEKSEVRKNILVIQSYEPGFSAYKDVDASIKRNFDEKKIQTNITTFYLDCENYLKDTEIKYIYEEFDRLAKLKPDIIIVNDDQATYSLLACNHPALDTLPVVFTGVNYPNIDLLNKYPNVTGFWDKPDYKTNIELIEQFVGNCLVTLLNDEAYLDLKIWKDLNEQVQGKYTIETPKTSDILLEAKSSNRIISSLKYEQNSTCLVRMEPRSSTRLLWGLTDEKFNNAFLATKRDFTAILVRLCTYPAFSVINESVGYDFGIIGGYFTTLETQNRDAVTRASRILKGEPVSSFPKITESAKNFVFDYKALDRWGVDWKSLPRESVILNLPYYILHLVDLIILGVIAGVSIIAFFIYQRTLYKRETQSKQLAQENLRKEKEFLSLALESGNIFAFRYCNGVFTFDNDFYRSLGIPVEPITFERFMEAIHPEEEISHSLNKQLLDTGFSSRQITRRRYDFNKKGYQWWEFRYAQNHNVEAPSTQSVEISGLCLNIQQIKDTENKLIQARKKAEEADLMKSTFLANMSHEIRTPLNAIVGFSQLLICEDSLSQEEKDEFIQIISRNSDLLLKLINDILDLSRIESGHMSFTFDNLNLSELIDNVYKTHQLLIPSGVELQKRVPETPAIICIDRHRLTQVLTNLINNASKFTSQGYIRISYDYSPDGRSILLSVSDTGKGIPQEKQAAVFERFQKLDQFAQGTGLGLAICQMIIDRFKGSIRLESEEGKGSTFIITLPYTSKINI